MLFSFLGKKFQDIWDRVKIKGEKIQDNLNNISFS